MDSDKRVVFIDLDKTLIKGHSQKLYTGEFSQHRKLAGLVRFDLHEIEKWSKDRRVEVIK